MKAKQFKIATWFINKDLLHKVDIHYENETKRAYTLLDILASKYFKIDKKYIVQLIPDLDQYPLVKQGINT